jgi:glycosyltransferase involved in cell wall biosynthesis
VAADRPWLSIVMPAWNGERYLQAALESVRHEGTQGYEIVAVDDGSTDRTLEILRSWATLLPLRIVERPGRGNWVAASNAALREARGRYACFLHQDDLWLPGRLAAIVREAKAKPALIVHSAMFVGPGGETLGPWRCPLPEGAVDPKLFAERLIVQNFIAIPAPVFDREAALRAGEMDESLWYTADWDFWLRLAREGSIRYLAAPLAAFRVHPGSQTMVRTDVADRRRQLETILERHGSAFAQPVRRAARFSIELNLALAAKATRGPLSWPALLGALARLGPAGFPRYLRDSRIVERVAARVRLLRPAPFRTAATG